MAATLTADPSIQNNIYRSEITTLIYSNKEMKDIMKTVKYIEKCSLPVDSVSEKSKNETKQQKGAFLGALLGTVVASLLENMFAGKGVIRAGEGVIRIVPDF